MIKKTAIASAAFLLVGANLWAQDTTYDFVSNDGGTTITGTLTLDAPSSPVGGGHVSDIVAFSVTDPFTTFTEADLFGPNLISGPFTWNPTQITSMDVTEFTYIGGPGDEAINFSKTGLGDVYLLGGVLPVGGYSDTGSWRSATAPDAASTIELLGMAFVGLGTFRRFRR
jgi:hypothetical protein